MELVILRNEMGNVGFSTRCFGNIENSVQLKNMKYNEIYTSFAIDKTITSRFELLIGIHPEQKRHLTEEEESLFFDFLH